MNALNPINTATATPVAGISERAMLAGLHVRQWTARKLDRKVTDKANTDHGARADAGRFNKALLSKDALADIASAVNAARTEHYARTLPWADDGARILSAAGYLAYANCMRDLRGKFDAAVSEFVGNYAAFVADSQARLGTMFNAADYPPADEIRTRFAFGVNILPMPDAGDFRVDLAEGQAEAIRADIAARMQEATDAAMRDVFQRVADKVGAMVERLNAYKPGAGKGDKAEGIFRDSLVENVRDLVALLPSLNLTGDPALDAIGQRMAQELCRHDADALRDDTAVRNETAKAAAAILADVSDYLA